MNDLKAYIDKSVLCWLATSSSDNIPNVSPKEVFAFYPENAIIIANIASPLSVKNIKENDNVCVSFIDVFVQKGFKINGKAEIVSKNDLEYATMESIILGMTEGKFPFSNIIKISIDNVRKIIAPKYILYPETTEEDQIKSAKKTYGV
ncbi:pyridoxamine 5'-phosphate oxidase family protein [Flavivirga algicola]|uniref:Pyridoxamine 5'-phosphate oxidase family protein n=1 Tax=Flavivirga algicola TaxID=2729136 RepID=A0ABX1S1H8_9FLAO|nr:pyridoxamine 5'-phosphate oxidase family protein [Flavivirga algicola]NMH88888.1 pyridoxamine 5'-phosphate oxidase family protein [Flavivirga algicola]